MSEHQRPRVTVCIPCYNSERTLAETLESVLAQDYPNMGVLVCDNSSKDRTNAIARSYADRGVEVIVNPVVKSAEDNWNFLLAHIPTEHFCLYHADDLYKPTMVSRQIDALVRFDSSAVFTMSELINDEGKVIPARVPSETTLPEELGSKDRYSFQELFAAILKHSNFIRTPTLCTTKTAMNEVGTFNYKQFRSSSDLDLWLRLSQWRPVSIIKDRLHLYRVSVNQASFQIYNNRVVPQDYFTVIDYYLNQPRVKEKLPAESLNWYEMYKGAEWITCGINALAKGDSSEGRKLLGNGLSFDNLIMATRSSKHLLKYMVAMVMYVLGVAGLGRAGAIRYKQMLEKRSKKQTS